MASRLARIASATTLDELYAIVPKPVNCDGSCWDSCGPIGYTAEEGRRMEEAGHRPPNASEKRTQLMCTALTSDHRCAVYEARPMICRVWGVSDVMPCDHGSCFTPFPLTTDETAALVQRSIQIGGDIDRERQHYQLRLTDLSELISRGRKDWNC